MRGTMNHQLRALKKKMLSQASAYEMPDDVVAQQVVRLGRDGILLAYQAYRASLVATDLVYYLNVLAMVSIFAGGDQLLYVILRAKTSAKTRIRCLREVPKCFSTNTLRDRHEQLVARIDDTLERARTEAQSAHFQSTASKSPNGRRKRISLSAAKAAAFKAFQAGSLSGTGSAPPHRNDTPSRQHVQPPRQGSIVRLSSASTGTCVTFLQSPHGNRSQTLVPPGSAPPTRSGRNGRLSPLPVNAVSQKDPATKSRRLFGGNPRRSLVGGPPPLEPDDERSSRVSKSAPGRAPQTVSNTSISRPHTSPPQTAPNTRTVQQAKVLRIGGILVVRATVAPPCALKALARNGGVLSSTSNATAQSLARATTTHSNHAGGSAPASSVSMASERLSPEPKVDQVPEVGAAGLLARTPEDKKFSRSDTMRLPARAPSLIASASTTSKRVGARKAARVCVTHSSIPVKNETDWEDVDMSDADIKLDASEMN